MGSHHIYDNEGNLHILDDEQYLAYLEMKKNSWPNKIKRFFFKFIAIIIAIVFILFMIGLCNGGKSKKNTKSDERTEVKANDEQSITGSENGIKPLNPSEVEEIRPQEVKEEEITNNEDVIEQNLSTGEEVNDKLKEEIEDNSHNSSQELSQEEMHNKE